MSRRVEQGRGLPDHLAMKWMLPVNGLTFRCRPYSRLSRRLSKTHPSMTVETRPGERPGMALILKRLHAAD